MKKSPPLTTGTKTGAHTLLTCCSARNGPRGFHRGRRCWSVSGHGSSSSVTGCSPSSRGQHAYALFRHTATSVKRARNGDDAPYVAPTSQAPVPVRRANSSAATTAAARNAMMSGLPDGRRHSTRNATLPGFSSLFVRNRRFVYVSLSRSYYCYYNRVNMGGVWIRTR